MEQGTNIRLLWRVQSQAVKANGFVFVSGQMPATLQDGKIQITEGTPAEKAHDMCKNAQIILEAAGSSLEKVVKTTVGDNGRREPWLLFLGTDTLSGLLRRPG